MTEEAMGWRLTKRDVRFLDDLWRAVSSLRRFAKTGQDVIGVGETMDAIECIANGSDIEVNVGLVTGFRRGEDGFEEGLFVSLRINEEEIILNELHTIYSKEVGSDHFTVDHASLYPHGHFDEEGITNWLAKLEEVSAWDDAALTVSRDHV